MMQDAEEVFGGFGDMCAECLRHIPWMLMDRHVVAHQPGQLERARRGLYGVRWPAAWAYRRGRGWLRRGYCPCCYSSPAKLECPVCFGRDLRPSELRTDGALLRTWERRWKELHGR